MVDMTLKEATPCPKAWTIRGTSGLEAYFDAFVRPNLPDASAVRMLHQFLRDYLVSQPRTFVVRDGRAKGVLCPVGGVRYYGSDNEAALWFWVSCQPGLAQRLRPLRELIEAHAFPIGDPNAEQEFRAQGATWRTWGKGDAAWPIRGANGWKLCHVYDAGAKHLDDTLAGLTARMVRLIHPLNHFLFPKPYRADYGGHRFDCRGLSTADPGEDPVVRSFARDYLAAHFGQDLVVEFRAYVAPDAGELAAALAPREFSIGYEYAAGSSAPTKQATALRLPALFQRLSAWYEATEGQPSDTRLDGKTKGESGGVGKALRLEVVESTNTAWNYNTLFKVAGDTQRGAVGAFLALYEASGGAYGKIFVESGRSKGGHGKKLKLALAGGVPGWQVLSERDWQHLALRAGA